MRLVDDVVLDNILFATEARRQGKPFVLLDVPPAQDQDAVSYVESQLRELVAVLEEAAGVRCDPDRLREAIRRSNRAREMALQFHELRRRRPAPVRGGQMSTSIGLMAWLASDIRSVFWIAVIPAGISFLLAWLALREPEQHLAPVKTSPLFSGFRELDRETKRLLQVGFLFTLARFSEAFLILKGIDIGLSEAMSPLTLAIFNLAYVVLAYPAGALSDRMRPRSILIAGIALLIAGNLVLAETGSFAGLVIGTTLWGAHMALTQGIFARMIADSAPKSLRATSFGAFWFVTGIGSLLASLGAGWLWDREGAPTTFLTSAAVAAVALAMLSLLEKPRPNA
jgi:MFS family permease